MANKSTRGAARRGFSKKLQGISEEQAEMILAKVRWGSEDHQGCPRCGTFARHYRRRARRQWRCREAGCGHVFSVTSGTRFDNHKLRFCQMLRLIVSFEASPKGITLARLANDVGMTEKSAHQNLHKIREAIRDFADRSPLKGLIHIDGAHLCGKLRKSNRRLKATADDVLSKHGIGAVRAQARKINARSPGNLRRIKKKRVVMALVEALPASNPLLGASPNAPRGVGRLIVAVCYTENPDNATELGQRYIQVGQTVFSDENPAYGRFSEVFDHHVVNHSAEYSTSDGVSDNLAESVFSRCRRAEYGVHHGFRPEYLEFYMWEMAWREMNRRNTQEKNIDILLQKMLSVGLSTYWRGYHGGNRRRDRRAVRREIVMARPGTTPEAAKLAGRIDQHRGV